MCECTHEDKTLDLGDGFRIRDGRSERIASDKKSAEIRRNAQAKTPINTQKYPSKNTRSYRKGGVGCLNCDLCDSLIFRIGERRVEGWKIGGRGWKRVLQVGKRGYLAPRWGVGNRSSFLPFNFFIVKQQKLGRFHVSKELFCANCCLTILIYNFNCFKGAINPHDACVPGF